MRFDEVRTVMCDLGRKWAGECECGIVRNGKNIKVNRISQLSFRNPDGISAGATYISASFRGAVCNVAGEALSCWEEKPEARSVGYLPMDAREVGRLLSTFGEGE